MHAPSLHQPRLMRVVLVTTFLLALAVRLWWVFEVQSPLDAIYSDMGIYVERAEMLLAGTSPGEPRVLAMWPWGTHAIIAGEFFVFGRHATFAIPFLHAVVGALVAPGVAALTMRFTRRVGIAMTGGCLVAIWHPHVLYTGYFSSEIWFTTALVLGTVALVRYAERGRGALACGVLLAMAFCCRPQILLTAVLVGAFCVLARLRGRPYFPRARFGMLLLVVPLALAMAGSAVRLHRLTGRIGLIAAYEPLQRLFGETNVDKVEATWTAANGQVWSYWFNPPTKKPIKNVVTIKGFICDPDLIKPIYEARIRKMSLLARWRRKVRNVVMLVADNEPWPENELPKPDPFRQKLQTQFGKLAYALVAFAALGVFALRRHRLAAMVVRMQLVTIVFTASTYLGETRYRVPYDPFLIVLAMVAILQLETWAGVVVRRVRRAAKRAAAR